MSADLKPLPVSGYTTQSTEKVELVNENKLLEELVLRQIDRHVRQTSAEFDQRMVALARTGIQDAFMWLNRAVFRPKRLAPQDTDDSMRMIAGTEDLIAVLLQREAGK